MTNQLYPNDRTSLMVYTLGAWTGILFLLYLVATIAIFTLLSNGYPASSLECFTMLEENRFIGLLRLDIVTVLFIPLYYIFFFAISHSMKKKYPLESHIAYLAIFAGITIFISNLNILELMTLSEKYRVADSREVQQQLLAAGEALLASDMWVSTSAKIRGILIESGALILSLLMLKSFLFRKSTAIIGILSHSFDLISEILSIFIPAVKDLFTYVAGPLYLVWFILVIADLFRLGRKGSPGALKATSTV